MAKVGQALPLPLAGSLPFEGRSVGMGYALSKHCLTDHVKPVSWQDGGMINRRKEKKKKNKCSLRTT